MLGLTMPTDLRVKDTCDLKENDWVRLVGVAMLDFGEKKEVRHGEILRTERSELVWICPLESVTGNGPCPILIVALNDNQAFGAISVGHAGRMPLSGMEEWIRKMANKNPIRLC